MSEWFRPLMFGVALILAACSPGSMPRIEATPMVASSGEADSVDERAIETTRYMDIAPLETPQREEDRLPDAVAIDSVDPFSTRLLGAQGDQRYWVAAGREPGEICAISMIQVGDGFISGAGCGGFLDFRTRGVSVAGMGLSQFAYTVVIPDGYAADARSKLDQALVRPNLIAFDSREALESTIAQHGRDVSLAHDSDEDRADLELYFSSP